MLLIDIDIDIRQHHADTCTVHVDAVLISAWQTASEKQRVLHEGMIKTPQTSPYSVPGPSWKGSPPYTVYLYLHRLRRTSPKLPILYRVGRKNQTKSVTVLASYLTLSELPAEADLGMCGLCGRTGAPTKRGPPHEDKHKFFYCC